MIYCKKCARLLDADVHFCPYCGSKDEDFIPETAFDPASETTLEKAFDPASEITSETTDETAVLLRKLDEHIARNTDAPIPDTSPPSTPPTQPEYIDPRDITIEPASTAYTTDTAHIGKSAPSTGQYVGMLLLSVFLTVPGLIVGIVYMTNKNPAYRKMGLIMLLISIGATVLWCVACCALFYAVGNAVMTTYTY